MERYNSSQALQIKYLVNRIDFLHEEELQNLLSIFQIWAVFGYLKAF